MYNKQPLPAEMEFRDLMYFIDKHFPGTIIPAENVQQSKIQLEYFMQVLYFTKGFCLAWNIESREVVNAESITQDIPPSEITHHGCKSCYHHLNHHFGQFLYPCGCLPEDVFEKAWQAFRPHSSYSENTVDQEDFELARAFGLGFASGLRAGMIIY